LEFILFYDKIPLLYSCGYMVEETPLFSESLKVVIFLSSTRLSDDLVWMSLLDCIFETSFPVGVSVVELVCPAPLKLFIHDYSLLSLDRI